MTPSATSSTNAPKRPRSLPVEQLATMAAPYNPREEMPEHEFEALRNSLRVFGAVEPVVVNIRTMNIVGGHQRVKAAAAEDIEKFPVSWVDLDDAGERQLNLALNRIAGRWDEDLLRDVLRTLKLEDADLSLTGFDEEELERFLSTMTDIELGDMGNGDDTGFASGSQFNDAGGEVMEIFLPADEADAVGVSALKSRVADVCSEHAIRYRVRKS